MAKAKKIDLKQLQALIRKSKTVMVATHEGPDGDGIGSILALGMGLKQLGKTVTFYMKDPVPKMYRYLPGSDRIVNQLPKGKKYDVCFIVDLGETERVGDAFVDYPGRGLTVSLDHHIRGEHNANLNFCLPRQASSGEVIFKILKALKVKLNRAMATNIYTAMVTDTGSFKYSNTTRETFLIAAELMKQKVDVWQVALNCFETWSVPRMELFKRVLSTLTIHPNKKIAWITLSKKDFAATGAAPDEAEGFISYARAVEGVEVAILFKEHDDGITKVSMRSKNRVDVAGIAESLGGGGHIRASGCKIKGTIVDAQKVILDKILAVI